MVFGGSGSGREAAQALLILATLLLAILPITIVNVPPPTHGIVLDFWPLPDWSTPAKGDAVATIRLASARSLRLSVDDRAYPVPLPSPSARRLELTEAGTILLEGRSLDLVGLRMALDRMRVRDETWLDLRPHPDAPYDRFLEVIAVIGRAGDFFMHIDNRRFRSAIPTRSRAVLQPLEAGRPAG